MVVEFGVFQSLNRQLGYLKISVSVFAQPRNSYAVERSVSKIKCLYVPDQRMANHII